MAEEWLIMYMDNILIHSNNQELHIARTRKMLECLREYKLFLKLEKCFFDKTKVKYLGMIVREGYVGMDPVKLATIKDWNCNNPITNSRGTAS